ncbi:MAG: guanylate kinase [Gemmatimonadales bacterium]|nr:guanylate kinase [Gemmatimonadales bacterium]
MSPRLVILSAPSGGGKTTIARRLEASRRDVGFSVSATTRTPRANEREGVDYYFFPREEFLRRTEAGEFLEWAEYAGHLYGTLTAEVDRLFARGKHVLLDIEVQGAEQVRRRRKDALAIFILPPSADELVRRLAGRRSETREQLARRIAQADRELEAALGYDRVVVNDDLDGAVEAVSGFIDGRAVGGLGQSERDALVASLQQELRRRQGEFENI